MIRKIIITTILIITILGLVIYFSTKEKGATPTQSLVKNSGSIFPLETVKSVITNIGSLVDGVTNNILIEEGAPTNQQVDNITLVTESRVGDFGFLNYNSTSTLWFINKNNGHISIVASDTPIEISDVNLPNPLATIGWGKNNKLNFIIRQLTGLTKIEIDTSSTSSKPVITKITDIDEVVLSPNQSQLLLIERGLFTLNIKLSDLDLKLKTDIFNLPTNDWVVRWVDDKKISIYNRPSWNIPGSFYIIDITTRTPSLILKNVNGLSAIASKNIEKVVYSGVESGKVDLFIKHPTKKNDFSLGFRTITDKCSWVDNVYIICAAPKNINGLNYFDDWYKGKISNPDELWLIKTDTDYTYLLSENSTNNNFDVLNIKISNNKDYIYFIDKNKSLLWQLDFKVNPLEIS